MVVMDPGQLELDMPSSDPLDLSKLAARRPIISGGMLIASALLPIIFVTVQLQNSVCGYKPSDREVNAIACITNVLGSALLELNVSDKANVDSLKPKIAKAVDKDKASAVFTAVSKSEYTKNARIHIGCLKGAAAFSVSVHTRGMDASAWFPNYNVEQCAPTTAEGLANIAFAVKILEQQCDKAAVVGPEVFLTSLWPVTATASPCLPPIAYGERSSDVMRTQLAICYDGFTKSLNTQIGHCDKVVTSCDKTVNAVTKAKLSIICAKSGKTTEVTPMLINACDCPGASQQGQNKNMVLEMFDRVCDDKTVSMAVAKETDPKQVEKLFSDSSTANALVAEERVDQSLEASPKLAKGIEEYFKKSECNCEGFKVTDCDKDWPLGPLLRCDSGRCTLDLTQLVEMNRQLTGAGNAGPSSGDSKPRRARPYYIQLIWSARKILCEASLNGKTFKIGKGKIMAKVSIVKSEFESALAKAAKNARQ